MYPFFRDWTRFIQASAKSPLLTLGAQINCIPRIRISEDCLADCAGLLEMLGIGLIRSRI